jgi:predicted nucleotidyltransferase
MSHGLSPDTVLRIKAVLAGYPAIEKAVLYGSRTKGLHRPGSDIDLAVFGDDLDFGLRTRLAQELDDLLLPGCD